MPSFIPVTAVQNLVEYLSKGIEDIPDEDWLRRKEALKRYKCEDPDYSIIMIARNEERFIYASLASISEQITNKKVEFILVDNGSSDRTCEIAERLGVRVILEKRAGWAEARQAGLAVAKGSIILTADGDNLYNPVWIDGITKSLERPEVIIACGQYCFYTFDNKYGFDLQLYQNLRWVNSKMRHTKRPFLNCLGGNMAYRRDLALSVGGYTMQVGRGEDGDLAFRLQDQGEIYFDDSREAFAYASLRNVLVDDSMFKTFKQRLGLHLKRIPEYFSRQN